MANVLAAHRSRVVVAGTLIFGAGALLGHVLTQTGPWGRTEAAFLALALVLLVGAVSIIRRMARMLDRVIRAWAPPEARSALDGDERAGAA